MNRCYTGTGSRKTPPEVLEQMSRIAIELESKGYTLRSGGSEGADNAFAECVRNREIYVPWKGFTKYADETVAPFSTKSRKSVVKFHPYPRSLSTSASKVVERSYFEVLGKNDTPSDFLVCWTKDGSDSGSAGQTIRIARKYGVPIYNLRIEGDLDKLYDEVIRRHDERN